LGPGALRQEEAPGPLFTAEALKKARTESNKCWKKRDMHPERDHLMQQCSTLVAGPVQAECRLALDDAFLQGLKAGMVGGADRARIRTELLRQAAKLKTHRIKHSFNQMSQGKTKVSSLSPSLFLSLTPAMLAVGSVGPRQLRPQTID
jgi:hypothetical protein